MAYTEPDRPISPMQIARPAPIKDRRILVLTAVVFVGFLAHVGTGTYLHLRPDLILREILKGPGQITVENSIIWNFRLPRALGAALVGWTLGVVGSAFQALLRNQLAEPYVIGVASGSAIGGVIATLLGFAMWAGGIGMLIAGVITGLTALTIVFGMGTRQGRVESESVLLSGVVIGAMLSSMLTMFLLAAGRDSTAVLRWLLGQLENIFWPQLAVLATVTLIGSVILVRQTRLLNAFALGEDSARRLGVNVDRLRWSVLVVGTTMTSAAVGTVGIIGFVGLAAPHIARRILGVDWRTSLLGSGLVGAGLLLLSDLIAQRGLTWLGLSTVMSMPVGVVTSVLGAPSLLILLRKRGKLTT